MLSELRAPGAGAVGQPGAHRLDFRADDAKWRATLRFPYSAGEVRMQHHGHVCIVEPAAIARIEIGFHRQSLSLDDLVARKLDMIVADHSHRSGGHLRDRRAIHQIADRDQHALGKDCMVR